MWYLAIRCDRKGITWVSLRLPKVVLGFCVVPVSKWYLGIYFCWNRLEDSFFFFFFFFFLVNFVVLGTYG